MLCNKCDVDKPKSEFAAKNLFYCRTCVNTQNKIYREKQRARDPKAYLEYQRLRQAKGRATNKKTRTTYLFHTLKHNAIKRGIEVAITKEELFILFELQGWSCRKTGIPFDLSSGKGKRPFGPSVDRINTKGNYSLGNIQLVCNIYNYAKHNFDENDVLAFAQALVKRNSI